MRKGPGQRRGGGRPCVSLLHSSTGLSNALSPGKGEEGTGSLICSPSLLSGVSLSFVRARQANEQGFHALSREVTADSSVTGSSPAPKQLLRWKRSNLAQSSFNVECARIFIMWWLLQPQHSCFQIMCLSSFYRTCKSHSMFFCNNSLIFRFF